MQTALREPVEAIILVTDGQPNTPWRQVTSILTAQNGGRKEIHVVGVGPYWDDATFLQFLIQLSRNNGGELVAATR